MTLEKQSVTLRDWIPYIIHAGSSCLNTNCIMVRLGEMRDCCVLTFFFYIVFSDCNSSIDEGKTTGKDNGPL